MNRVSMTMLAIAVLGLGAGTAEAQRARRTPPRTTTPETVIAIQHATLRTGEGAPLADATIVIRGERIVSVAAGGAVPAGATVIDATGMIATAGLVSTMTPIGLAEIELEDGSSDMGHEGDDADAIRASFAAADGYNPLSTLIPVARLGGITTAMSVPEGGLVAGTSAWVDLAGRLPGEVVRDSTLALHVSLDDGGISAVHGARSAAFNRFRELLDDARLYARSRAQFDRGQFRDTEISRLDLERVGQALAGELPVVVRVARAADIVRVIALGQEYGLRLVLAGCEEGWMVAREIDAADVPVIVQPLTNLPMRFSALHARYDNPAILSRAGVDVILMAPGAWDIHNLRQEAGNAVAHGMDWDAALRGITSIPARVFGMDADYGTVAAGRVASVVLWSGDPFETTTVVRRVIVRGHDMPLVSRQTELFRRYRSLEGVPRGWSSVPQRPPPPREEGEAAEDGEASEH